MLPAHLGVFVSERPLSRHFIDGSFVASRAGLRRLAGTIARPPLALDRVEVLLRGGRRHKAALV
ncbi:MAG: hypothetical protein EA397_04325 [Deltaproteobacteria bacterium]|nr:MAG: hypothetical protein EA397_04325 [Deltaproteobacteria bacterium]